MEKFTGRITKDGKLITEDVDGSISHTQGPIPRWNGTLDAGRAKTAHELFLMGGFDIELADGRRGHANAAGYTGGTSVIKFTGSGPLS